MQWIYRAKKYYNMLPPDISTLLIPIHYRIHVDQLKDLVEAPSVDEFLKLVTRTPYLRHTDTQTPASIETIYKDCLYRLYLADRRSNPYSISPLLGSPYILMNISNGLKSFGFSSLVGGSPKYCSRSSSTTI